MANPHISKLVIGGAGQGKSTVLKLLEEKYGDKYNYLYIDCCTETVQDNFLTVPDVGIGKLVTWLNERWKIDENKPIIIMLDEVLKASTSVKRIFTRLIQEHNLGGKQLPKDSLVFGTSNRTQDGLGDFIEAHVGNRFSIIHLKNVTAKELIVYGTKHNWNPNCLAFLLHKPECLADYREAGQENNGYIMNPKHPNRQFCSPRSLENAFSVYDNRESYKDEWQPVDNPDHNLRAMLGGLCGDAFQNDFMVFMKLVKDVINPQTIIDDPVNAPIPTDQMAQFMQILSCVQFAKDESIENANKFWTYVKRFKDEQMISTFCFSLFHIDKKMTKSLRGYDTWMSENHDLVF